MEESLGGPAGFILLSPLVPFHTIPATVNEQEVSSRKYQHHCEGLPYLHYSSKAESELYLHANTRGEQAQMMLADCF